MVVDLPNGKRTVPSQCSCFHALQRPDEITSNVYQLQEFSHPGKEG